LVNYLAIDKKIFNFFYQAKKSSIFDIYSEIQEIFPNSTYFLEFLNRK